MNESHNKLWKKVSTHLGPNSWSRPFRSWRERAAILLDNFARKIKLKELLLGKRLVKSDGNKRGKFINKSCDAKLDPIQASAQRHPNLLLAMSNVICYNQGSSICVGKHARPFIYMLLDSRVWLQFVTVQIFLKKVTHFQIIKQSV